MRDLAIADVDNRGMRLYEGIFGEVNHLGSDFMLGDFSIDNLPIPTPRPQPQNNAKNIVKAVVAAKGKTGQKSPTIGIKKVIRKKVSSVRPSPFELGLSDKEKMAVMAVGIGMIIIFGTR